MTEAHASLKALPYIVNPEHCTRAVPSLLNFLLYLEVPRTTCSWEKGARHCLHMLEQLGLGLLVFCRTPPMMPHLGTRSPLHLTSLNVTL